MQDKLIILVLAMGFDMHAMCHPVRSNGQCWACRLHM